MHVNKAVNIKSSFLSCEKDVETIIRKLFVESQPHSDQLKRLLMINTKDCLDNSNQNYNKLVKNTSVKDLIEGKYFTTVPRIKMKEHEEVKSYIILTFDDFAETTNPEYRDCTVSFDIMCPLDYWDLTINFARLKLQALLMVFYIIQNFLGLVLCSFLSASN